MDSSTTRTEDEARRQAQIRAQIAALQAQLPDVPSENRAPPPAPLSPKRKRPAETLLAPATPSPKKRKLKSGHSGAARSTEPRRAARQADVDALPTLHARTAHGKRTAVIEPAQPPASTVFTKLADLSRRVVDEAPATTVQRSSAFSERPQPPSAEEMDRGVAKRDDRLALVEDLELGPADHKPPFDDPNFDQLEPNSGIRLSSRTVPHDDLQDHLRGRYYLSPSRLYSAIRLLPNKLGYDVPVAGDWITIAVVAERGPVKFTRAPVGVGKDEDAPAAKTHAKGKGKGAPQPEPRPTGKKFVNVKLVDFGARARGASSATGGKAVIRGDAFLTLLLFEADGFDVVKREGAARPEKMYKGGSRGAFEAMSKLKEGDVVALLNPRILKPFQRAADAPHPTSNILAITPESAESIMVIGRARDLGMCAVVKRDGKPCGSWCDKRVSDVCEWHVQNAVERRRAGRAEFSAGTSGMGSAAAPRRKPAYDPARQWGLKPEPAVPSGGATYIVAGHVVGAAADAKTLFVGENIGREGQAKAARRAGKDADRALKALLQRDKEGMRAVMRARAAVLTEDEENEGKGGKGTKKGTKESGSRKGKGRGASSESEDEPPAPDAPSKSYSAHIIKHLGFDPAVKAGQRRADDATVQAKLQALAAVQSTRKTIALGPRPGQRIRSGVVAPSPATAREQGAPGPSAGEGRTRVPADPGDAHAGGGDGAAGAGLVDLDLDLASDDVQRHADDAVVQAKLRALAAVARTALGDGPRRPGRRVRSGGVVPVAGAAREQDAAGPGGGACVPDDPGDAHEGGGVAGGAAAGAADAAGGAAGLVDAAGGAAGLVDWGPDSDSDDAW